MNLKGWEATIQQIADEIRQVPNGPGQHRILAVWRAKLEKEPTSLQPYQIDEIVREVRTRILSSGELPPGDSPRGLTPP
jgi:hypothetical protein